MDRQRFVRPGIQKPSQTPKQTLGISQQPVPKVISSRAMDGIVWPKKNPTGQKQLHVLRPIMDQPRPVNPQLVIPQPKPVRHPAPIAVPDERLNFDMELPGQESPSPLVRLQHFKWQKVRRGASRGVAVALVLIITMGGLLFSQSYYKLHKVFKGSTATAAALKVNVNPDLLKGEGSGRVNILLLGRGGGTHDGPDLTDTMMIASVDPVNHTTTLLSLPRDLWVNVPDHGDMKLNAAWETGEFKYLGKIAPGSNDPKAILAGLMLSTRL